VPLASLGGTGSRTGAAEPQEVELATERHQDGSTKPAVESANAMNKLMPISLDCLLLADVDCSTSIILNGLSSTYSNILDEK
jgi:hypothetical protein